MFISLVQTLGSVRAHPNNRPCIEQDGAHLGGVVSDAPPAQVPNIWDAPTAVCSDQSWWEAVDTESLNVSHNEITRLPDLSSLAESLQILDARWEQYDSNVREDHCDYRC